MNTVWDSFIAEYLTREAFIRPRKSSFRVLRRLLRKSYQTQFGLTHRLRPTMSIDEFRSTVPIRGYADYEPWLKKIRLGEANVLWPGRPLYFATTSGTTSDNKTIPVTSDFIRDYHLGTLISLHRMLLHTPRAVTAGILTLGGPSKEGSIGNVPVGSITGILYKTLPNYMIARLVVPPEVHNIPSHEEKLYVIARLALEASVSGIITMVPGALLVLCNAINEMAEELIDEILEGSMRRLRSCPAIVEQNLRAHLHPAPRRADFLRSVWTETGKLLPARIWPIKGICAYTKQASPSQWASIRRSYGDVTLIDPGLVATEGRVSVGLFPNKNYHAMIPLSSFIELLPLDSGSSFIIAGEAVLPCEARVGQTYCPVISSANGLIRYRLDDVIRVCRRIGGVPLVEYVGRLDDSLSVAGEKVSEAHFRETIEVLRDKGFLIEGAWLVGHSWSEQMPLYHFIWETAEDSHPLATQLDQVLQQINVSYRRKRQQGLLLPIKATPVGFGKLPIDRSNIRWIGQSKIRHLYRDSVPSLPAMNEIGHEKMAPN